MVNRLELKWHKRGSACGWQYLCHYALHLRIRRM